MFPLPWPIVVFYLLAYALAGMTIGVLTGWLISRMTGSKTRTLLKDGFLGSFGYLAGIFGCLFMPWPRNTISYRLEGGTVVTSTMNTYQHPERVAFVVAILLPLLNELYRWRKAKRSSVLA